MSAIGDYIHLTGQGYLNEGVESLPGYATSGKGIGALNKSLSTQRESVQRRVSKIRSESINKSDREALEVFYNSILNPSEGDSYSIDIQKKLNEIMHRQFENTMQSIDFSKGNVVKNKGLQIPALSPRFHDEDSTLSGYVSYNLANIEKKLDAIFKAPESAQAINEGQKIAKEVEEIIDQCRKRKKSKNASISNLSGQSEWLNVSEQVFASSRNNIYKDLQNSLLRLNEWSAVNAAYENTAFQKGELIEYLSSFGALLAEAKVYESIDDVVKNLESKSGADLIKIGAVTEPVQYNSDFFNKEIEAALNKNTKMRLKTSTSQGKIDVNFRWDDQKIVKASVKNYNLGKNNAKIHLVTGTSLLFLLQDENKDDFTNHVLNAYATHTDDAGIAEMRRSILPVLQSTILLKAAAGGAYGREQANLMIVNDNTTGKVRVVSVADMIDSARDNAEIKINDGGVLSASSPRFKNVFAAAGAHGRIASVVSEMHRQKIAVSILGNSIARI